MNRLPFDKQVAVIAALCEGMSIRGVERLAGVHRDTIMRLGFRAGVGCGRLHDYLFSDLNVGAIQIDELWSFIGKKQRRLKDGERLTKGDFYTFVALDSTNKAIIAYRVGKRDGDLSDPGREPREHPFDFDALTGLQLAHAVVGIQDIEGLDEDRLTGGGAVVDDARNRRARRCLDGEDRTAGTLGREAFLQMLARPLGG